MGENVHNYSLIQDFEVSPPDFYVKIKFQNALCSYKIHLSGGIVKIYLGTF